MKKILVMYAVSIPAVTFWTEVQKSASMGEVNKCPAGGVIDS